MWSVNAMIKTHKTKNVIKEIYLASIKDVLQMLQYRINLAFNPGNLSTSEFSDSSGSDSPRSGDLLRPQRSSILCFIV